MLCTPAFADRCERIDLVQAYTAHFAPPTEATCSGYLAETGGLSVSCYWSWPYRNIDAKRFADALWSDVQMCREGQSLDPDTPVNHPDSYILRQWQTAQNLFAVSIKDKAARGETLVFLRVMPRE